MEDDKTLNQAAVHYGICLNVTPGVKGGGTAKGGKGKGGTRWGAIVSNDEHGGKEQVPKIQATKGKNTGKSIGKWEQREQDDGRRWKHKNRVVNERPEDSGTDDDRNTGEEGEKPQMTPSPEPKSEQGEDTDDENVR